MTTNSSPESTHQPGRPSAEDRAELHNMIMGAWASQAVRAFAALSVAEHLTPGPLTSGELARLAGSDPTSTDRLLRAGVPLGLTCFDVETRQFSGTQRLSLLNGSSTGSLKNYAQAAIGPAFWRPAQRLVDAVLQGRPQAEPELGTSVVGWLTRHPDDARQLAAGMSELSAAVIEEAVRHLDTTSAHRIVDVGGAEGEFLAAALRNRPDATGVVLDTEAVVPSVAATARRHGLDHRMSGVAGDFLDRVPPGDLYLLKFVLHDWDDATCRQLLINVRAAMPTGARVVVVEMAASADHVPLALATMDLAMMFAGGGRERTLEEFATLLTQAGLMMTDVVPLTAPYHLIEARA